MGGRKGGVGLGARAVGVFGWRGRCRNGDTQGGCPRGQVLLDVLLGLDGAQDLDEVREIVELVWAVISDKGGRTCIVGSRQQCCKRTHCPEVPVTGSPAVVSAGRPCCRRAEARIWAARLGGMADRKSSP